MRLFPPCNTQLSRQLKAVNDQSPCEVTYSLEDERTDAHKISLSVRSRYGDPWTATWKTSPQQRAWLLGWCIVHGESLPDEIRRRLRMKRKPNEPTSNDLRSILMEARTKVDGADRDGLDQLLFAALLPTEDELRRYDNVVSSDRDIPRGILLGEYAIGTVALVRGEGLVRLHQGDTTTTSPIEIEAMGPYQRHACNTLIYEIGQRLATQEAQIVLGNAHHNQLKAWVRDALS